MRAAADAAAQLVQLRQAEPLRVLDHHHRRVRHVDADLDDGGRDQDVRSRPRANARMTRSFSSGFMPPVQQRRRGTSGKTSCARWSAISVAARRSTFSDSSTSG